MENQITSRESQNYYKRRFAAIIVFSIFFIFLGRHLTFLPTINLSMKSNTEHIKADVQKITKNKKGFYSMYYKNLNGGKKEDFFGIEEKQIQTGSSVNKVPIIAALYFFANKGDLSLDDKITISEIDVQDYGTGSIRYKKMPQVYSMRNLAKIALKESDNTAAYVLAVKIGTDKIQKLVNSWGLTQTNMENNKTTVFDMSLLFEKIFKREITNESDTRELLEFLTDSNFEDRLPKELPKNAKVYHKTGDGEGFVHDVGIIQTEQNVYYLGIMTSDIGEQEAETKNTIAEISKKIFDSLNN